MLIERTKVKRKESLLTMFGKLLGWTSQMLAFFADMFQNEIEEKEVAR
jgi:hypothetical protein